MNIGRTLFWFKDGDEQLVSDNLDFFEIGTLLNRLLNEVYDGKKIKFINVYFYTDKLYELYPVVSKNAPYYYGGHLSYYGSIDIYKFNMLNWDEKKKFIWDKACEYLKESAKFTKNNKLFEAVEHAYLKGLEEKLNPDYRILDNNINYNETILRVSLWINFKEDGMYSNLIIENNERIVFDKEIDKTCKGLEFFLEMYKAMEFDGSSIIIKGHKDVDYLPLRIPLSEIVKESSL